MPNTNEVVPGISAVNLSEYILQQYGSGIEVGMRASTRPPVAPSPNHYRSSLESEYMRSFFNIPSSNDGLVPFRASTQYIPPWPVGTIIRLKNNFPDFPFLCADREIPQNYPLAKVMAYKNDNIHKILWLGHAEVSQESWSREDWQEANPFEIAHYEEAYKLLNPCQSAPAIGTVVQYIGKDKDLRNKRLLVINHNKNNAITVKWLRGAGRLGLINTLSWSIFRICPEQKDSFVPDMSNYCQCGSCGSTREIASTIIIRTAPQAPQQNATNNIVRYCDSECVRNSGYERCANCNEWHIFEGPQNTVDGFVCHNCFTNNYCECADCGRKNHRNNMLLGIPENVCRSCLENRSKIIHDYSYKPSPRFNKMAWENTRYLGVELEVEHKSIVREIFAKILKKWLIEKKLDKLIYFKNDGSLSNGIEIVFHPYTLKSFHKNFPMKGFLEYIHTNGGDVSSGKCGMHVHVSKEKLTTEQLIKGKWFFYKCAEFLKRYSGRKNFNYCYFEDEPGGDPYSQRYGRHTAFNVAGSTKTLEIRLFNATLEYKKFLSNIQFSDVFVDYIQNGPGIAFLKLSSSHLIWQNFIDYAKKDGQYQVLTNYILQNAIV